MKNYHLLPLSIEQFLGIPRPKPAYSMYRETITYGDKNLGTIDIASRGVTVVLSRDVHANVRRAADAAVAIAYREEHRSVFYINSFASAPLVQDAMRAAMLKAGRPAPIPDLRYSDDSFFPEFDERDIDANKHTCPKERENQRRARQSDYIYRRGQLEAMLEARKGDAHEAQTNLTIYGVPMGTWIANHFVRELTGSIDWAVVNNPKMAVKPPVIIVNAFEFAAMSGGEKWKIARELMTLCEKYQCAVVVFSQEMRSDLERGKGGRGAMGLLCAMAERVLRIADPFEQLIRKRTPRVGANSHSPHSPSHKEPPGGANRNSPIHTGKAIIHEVQTQPPGKDELGMMNDEGGLSTQH